MSGLISFENPEQADDTCVIERSNDVDVDQEAQDEFSSTLALEKYSLHKATPTILHVTEA